MPRKVATGPKEILRTRQQICLHRHGLSIERETGHHQQPDLAEPSANKLLGTAEARPPRRHQDGVKSTRHPFQAAPLCVLGFAPFPPEARTSRGRGELGYHLPWYRRRDLKDSSAGPLPASGRALANPTLLRHGEADSPGRSKPACRGCSP